MNKNEIKQIILEEIQAVIKEQTEDERIAQAMETGDEDELESLAAGNLDRAEQLAADSRPEEEDFDQDDAMDMAKDFNDEQNAIFGKPNFVEEDNLEEMARTSNVFKLKDGAGLKDVLQFMQRVNDKLKTFKSPGQKRPKKRFTPEEMKALATAMVNPDGFTSKDIIANTSYNSPAQANKFLKALEMKGLITLTSQLKKSMEPTRDPDAPETRGRKRRDAEFDMSDDPMADLDALGLGGDIDLSDPLAENVHKEKNTKVGGRPDPRYGRMKIDFASDVDKALYIVYNALSKSKREPEFLSWLSSLGYTQAEMKSEGKKIKDELKKQVQKHPDFPGWSKWSQMTGTLKISKAALGPSKKSTNENKTTMSELEKYIKKVIKERKSLMQEAPSEHTFKSPETVKNLEGLANTLPDYVRHIKRSIKMGGFNSNNHLPSIFQSLTIMIGQVFEKLKELEGPDVMSYDSIGGDTIREGKNPLAAKMKEVEIQGRTAALETKLAAVAEMIEETEGRLTRIDEDNEFRDMMDKGAVKEVRKQLKELERAQAKLQKEYDKVSGGRKKEKVVDELDAEGARDKADNLDALADKQDALDQEAEDSMEEVSFELNESTLRMQKLAGLITESDIKKKLSLKEEDAGAFRDASEINEKFFNMLSDRAADYAERYDIFPVYSNAEINVENSAKEELPILDEPEDIAQVKAEIAAIEEIKAVITKMGSNEVDLGGGYGFRIKNGELHTFTTAEGGEDDFRG